MSTAIARSMGRVGVPSSPAVVVGFAATLFAVAIFILTRGYPMDSDGAVVVAERLPATWASLLLPYHQHWSLVPILIYDHLGSDRDTLLVLLLATHVALAVGVTALLELRIGRTWALAIGVPIALLGSARYDLLSPFQILFTIALLCGLVAVWASIERARSALHALAVAGALVVAVMTSNVGVFVILALGLWFVAERRSRQMLELLPASLLFVVWYATFGRLGLRTDGDPTSQATLLAVVPYTLTAIASSAGLGLGPIPGAFALGAIATRVRPSPATLAFLAGIVAMFAAAALFRSYGDTVQATTSRYIYLSAVIAAFGLAAGAPRLPEDRRVLWVSAGVAVVNVAILLLVLPVYAAGGYG